MVRQRTEKELVFKYAFQTLLKQRNNEYIQRDLDAFEVFYSSFSHKNNARKIF